MKTFIQIVLGVIGILGIAVVGYLFAVDGGLGMQLKSQDPKLDQLSEERRQQVLKVWTASNRFVAEGQDSGLGRWAPNKVQETLKQETSTLLEELRSQIHDLTADGAKSADSRATTVADPEKTTSLLDSLSEQVSAIRDNWSSFSDEDKAAAKSHLADMQTVAKRVAAASKNNPELAEKARSLITQASEVDSE